MRKKGGDRNAVAWWNDEIMWYPFDYVPAWVPPNGLNFREQYPFEFELLPGQTQKALPLYINNDAKLDGIDIIVLEASGSDIGFGKETYLLKEAWDSLSGDADLWKFMSDGDSSHLIPELKKMFLVDERSSPSEVPKLVVGGQFSMTTIVIEDAQSLVPPIRLSEGNDNYTVSSSIVNDGKENFFKNADAVYGGSGDDQIAGNNMRDHLFGEAGNDILQSGGGGDFLNGGSGNDKLYGEVGAGEMLDGMMGNDILWGYAGEDIVLGGAGNDILKVLYSSSVENSGAAFYAIGGAGKDRFDFYDLSKKADLPDYATGIRIDDFSAADDLLGVYVGISQPSSFSNLRLPVNSSIRRSQFRTGTAARDRNDYFVYDGTTLYFDADGSGPQASVEVASVGAGLTYRNIITFNDDYDSLHLNSTLSSLSSAQLG